MKLKNILNILNPQLKIGALEVTDFDLKFARIKGGVPVLSSMKLAPGIIKEGKIVSREAFLDSLLKFHSQISSGRKKKIYIILNIPDNNIYSQIFNLPSLKSEALEDAVNLNLRMISPIDFNSVYSDWQTVSKDQISNSEQLEILAAFIQAQIIDEFDDCLRQAGFIPAAVEFSGLSLVRLAVESGQDVDIKNPFLLLHVGNNGMNFNLIRNGNLYFNHFVSWQSTSSENRQISFEVFKQTVVNEIKKVLSFYSSHWDGQINDLLLTAPGLEDNLVKIVNENFSFKTKVFSLWEFKNINPIWFSVLGSALRGRIPRAEDKFISLAKVGTEEEFYRHRALSFAKTWRNIILSVLGIILIIFFTADLFLKNIISSLNAQMAAFSSNKQAEILELTRLQKEIKGINKNIDIIASAYKEKSIWSPFFEKMNDLAGSDVVFKRIFIQSADTPILISAFATSEDAALNFRNKLMSDNSFKDVDLPITKITPAVGGIEFVVSFKFKG